MRPPTNIELNFQSRFVDAIKDFETGDLDGFRTLLLDPELPRYYRLRANLVLADNNDDWDLTEEYRKEAERVYAELRVLYPVGSNLLPAEEEEELADIRQDLTDLANEQAEDAQEEEEDCEEEEEKEKEDQEKQEK